MQQQNPGPLKNPFHIALSRQREATYAVGGHLEAIVGCLTGIDHTLKGLGGKPSRVELDDAQVDRLARTAAGYDTPDKAVALAVILFERTGDVVNTTAVGKWFEHVAADFVRSLKGSNARDKKIKGRGLLTIGDLAQLALPENDDLARDFARILADSEAPVALIAEMDEVDFRNFLRLLPQLALRLDQAAPPSAPASTPGNDPA